VSLFVNRVSDFILVDYGYMMKPNGAVRNVDAASLGGELGAQRALGRNWSVDASLAYVRARTQRRPTAGTDPALMRGGASIGKAVGGGSFQGRCRAEPLT
jgi:hypothetical protein